MGRHRRSAAGRAATGRATGVTHHEGAHEDHGPLHAHAEDGTPTMGIAPYLNPDAYAETYAKSEAYLFATPEDTGVIGTAVFAGSGHEDLGGAGHGGYGHAGYAGHSDVGQASGAFPNAGGDLTVSGLTEGGFPSGGLQDGGFPGGGFPDGGLTVGGLTGGGLPGPRFPDDGLAGSGLPDGGLAAGALQDGGLPGYNLTDDSLPRYAPAGRRFPDSSFSNRDFTGGAFRRDPFPDVPDDGHIPGADGPRAASHRRRKKKAVAPVRSGLLGVSAAVALGTVAVATGAVPGLENYKLGGGSSAGDSVQAGNSSTNTPSEQGGTSGSLESPSREAGNPASRDSERPASPQPSPPTSSAAPTETPEKDTPEAPPNKPEKEKAGESGDEAAKPEKPEKPEQAKDPVATASEAAAAARVLALVNQERAKAGCRPVTPDRELAGLAAAFSEDMAQRGFFDHTDPDGDTPWDRAKQAGIADLGGENIARGQADAESVMQAWMDSPGHRANILNCDFRTLGVGVHFGSGGPWWTQNFGY